MTLIILSNGEYYQIPEGADPDAVRRMQERQIANQATPPKRTRRYGSYHHTSRREQQYRSQAALVGTSLSSLVERVNTREEIE